MKSKENIEMEQTTIFLAMTMFRACGDADLNSFFNRLVREEWTRRNRGNGQRPRGAHKGQKNEPSSLT